MKIQLSFCMLLLVGALGVGCKNADDNVKPVNYKGPVSETYNQVTIYSDSAQIKLKMTAPLQQDLENGDILYPKGLYITFYENGVPTSMVTSKYGKYDKLKDQYFVRNDVVVKNIVKNEQLNTEELYWNRQKRNIFTDKFVRITSAEEVVTGVGLTANEDFSNYKLDKFSGSFTLNE
ncbi:MULTISPECIES: LPS export ABC transporter periplasmic protein LptC [Rufibacter]|uniref:LPS export ABC transporter protein LptC n=1 Tax=Rufibacter quisquiliarum TaxID=1549639 RepID=A0A839GAN5_9BACT|nr:MULTISPECIES: LPS export ABC transporter periplasmic protein LptC [Rufibacter]MBA9075992.1 LPS export ABC transporter protein LptC [Rufibacter quisquiliarum]